MPERLLPVELVPWLVELSPDPVLIVDGDGLITHLNGYTEELFGYRREELLGRPVELLVPNRVANAHSASRAKYLFDPHARPMGAGMELAARRKDGSEFPVDIALSPVNTDEGVLAIAAVRDITQQKKAEKERGLLKMQQGMRLESLGRLAGGVAHDFNNLTAVVQNFSDFVADAIAAHRLVCATEDGLDMVDEDIETIRGAAKRAAGLTRQLLIFGQKEVTIPETLSLNEVIGSLENLLRRSIGENVTLSVRLDPSLRPVNADESQMEQIIVNLAMNARDAIPDTGALIVETENFDIGSTADALDELEPGPYVRLTISDTGVGMTTDVIARAFEPFFTTKPAGEGTGLGLATVHAIVTQHGGVVRLYSDAGTGTTVRVYLPALVGADEAPTVSEPSPVDRTCSILVCDDEERVRELSRRILATAGYQVFVADDPAKIGEGLPDRIDLLLTDVVMPHVSGRQVANELHKRWPALKILYMSGYPEDLIKHRGMLEPGVELIRKPFTRTQLLDRVREVTSRTASLHS